MEINKINQIKVTGYAKSIPEYSFTSKKGTKYYTFDLAVIRMSGKEDVVPILAREDRLIPIELGDCVSIIGAVTTRNWRNHLSVRVSPEVMTITEPVGCTNEVELDGYVARPPYTKEICESEKVITDFLIAINQGEKSDYVPVILWNRLARMSSNLECGKRIHITGRFQSREYIKPKEDGTLLEKVAYEVSGRKIWIYGEGE